MLDGRVKTIHPRIAGGILAMRSKPEHMSAIAEHGIPKIDLVCVNLYEFEKIAAKKDAPLAELIENIDIGGPTMIRAAAKNYQDVAVVTSSADYAAMIEELRASDGSLSPRHALASGEEGVRDHRGLRSRRHCAPGGNSADQGAVCPRCSTFARRDRWRCVTAKIRTSRPRCTRPGNTGIAGAEQLHGKELSYNNLVDLDAAWQLIGEFDAPRVGDHQAHESLRLRGERDAGRELPAGVRGRSDFGLRRRAGLQSRSGRGARPGRSPRRSSKRSPRPDYSDDALKILTAKKNLRLLRVAAAALEPVVKSITGGFLVQTPDVHRLIARRSASEDQARPDGRRMGRARIRLENLRST